jgi:hypothetical protein
MSRFSKQNDNRAYPFYLANKINHVYASDFSRKWRMEKRSAISIQKACLNNNEDRWYSHRTRITITGPGGDSLCSNFELTAAGYNFS